MEEKYILKIRGISIIGRYDIYQYDNKTLDECMAIIKNHKNNPRILKKRTGEVYEFAIYEEE